MRSLVLLLVTSFMWAQAPAPQRMPPIATRNETVEALGYKWLVPEAGDWKVEGAGDNQVLHMQVARPAESNPRRPTQFAVADTADWQQVTVEAEVLRGGGSLIVVYAYRDPDFFNYTHLSVDPAAKVPKAHNGIFHVYGGDRVRISRAEGPPTLDEPKRWQKVVLNYDAATGKVNVTVDGKAHPAHNAVDLSLGAGKVGLGSFFETASFRNVRISGKPASK